MTWERGRWWGWKRIGLKHTLSRFWFVSWSSLSDKEYHVSGCECIPFSMVNQIFLNRREKEEPHDEDEVSDVMLATIQYTCCGRLRRKMWWNKIDEKEWNVCRVLVRWKFLFIFVGETFSPLLWAGLEQMNFVVAAFFLLVFWVKNEQIKSISFICWRRRRRNKTKSVNDYSYLKKVFIFLLSLRSWNKARNWHDYCCPLLIILF